MNKVKKLISSIGVFIISIISKVYAIGPGTIVSMYAVDPGPEEKVSSVVEIISKIGKITIPIILFVIGLVVIINKKIAKKIKIITISALLGIGFLSWIILNYIANNY